MSKFKKLLSYLVFPFQGSIWINFFSEYLPFGLDGETLYFSLYGERSAVYTMSAKFINKTLLEDFKIRYKKLTYLSHVVHSSNQSDVTIADYQQIQFLIILKPRLIVEYDSTKYYRIYYSQEFDDTEFQEVLSIFRKNQKIDWPKSLRYIHLN